ncbi:Exosome complex uclease [Phytophthora megakarya]|uniref:Ribosomal RNA-processing protein 44 n=1 Tax=Phytophthora megakarya TaxID=4795 RepID=A0A225W0G8_9STRA|nr:Exosome complex uclease [Phytophthora megakarya]
MSEKIDEPHRVEVVNFATKDGRIIRQVTERYLRDDLSCSLPFCDVHHDVESSRMQTIKLLAEHPRNGVYLLPSMKMTLFQIDTLEFSTKSEATYEVFQDVVVLETVWEFVRRQDVGVYQRLITLIRGPERRFVAFANEHHRDCFVDKNSLPIEYNHKARETQEERDERAVAVAWKWFIMHLNELQRTDIRVLFLAFDEEDLELSLTSHSSEEKKLKPEGVSISGSSRIANLYPEYLPMQKLLHGIQNKKFFKGVLRCGKSTGLECYVLIHGSNSVNVAVIIQGPDNINRAIDGDVVVVQIFSKDQWITEADGATDNEVMEPEFNKPMISGEELMEIAPNNAKPVGRVVGIIQRIWGKYCGNIALPNVEGAIETRGSCLVVPENRKIPRIKIRTRQLEFLMNKRIVVEIDSWPADSRFPLGHYVQTLGVVGNKEAETKVLLMEHNISFNEFDDAVMQCLPSVNWKITQENSKGRRDLRHLMIISIDPPNCHNIDDTLHVQVLSNKNLEVGVHIADVTHFVVPGSALDKEAARRGISTYLLDKRFDMLPDILTTEFCSLTDTGEHFAFSVIWELKLSDENKVEIIGVDFCKSIISPVASMTYEEAHIFLTDPTAGSVLGQSCMRMPDESIDRGRHWLGSWIKTLSVIANRLRANRLDAGAETLAVPNIQLGVDSNTNPLNGVRDTNALVEEFMLLADITVANKILHHFPECSLLRRNPPPSKCRLDELQNAARSVGVELQTKTSKEFQASLSATELNSRRSSKFIKVFRMMKRRCMMPASYIISGMERQSEYYHYGLAAPVYTHFTSPMRRYADIEVHRLLAAAIGVASLPRYFHDNLKMLRMCDSLNKRYRAAHQASRVYVDLLVLLHFQQYPTRMDAIVTKVKHNGIRVMLSNNKTPDAIVTKVKHNGIRVMLSWFGIEGMIFLCEKKQQDTIQFDVATHSITLLHKKNRRLQVFDRVYVKVYVETSPFNRQILKLELLDEDDKEVRSRKSFAQKEAESALHGILSNRNK